MRILLAASEVHPYAKTGGLADMVAALGKSLAQAGHQVGIVMPLYRGLAERFPLEKLDWWLQVPLDLRVVPGEVWTHGPLPGLTVYFVHVAEFFSDRAGLYGAGGRDFPDNAARFTLFAKAVAHLARYLPWQPEIVHLHDWQAGLVPLLVRHQAWREGWARPPATVLTIHNLAYQGFFGLDEWRHTNLPRDYLNPDAAEFHGGWSMLKAGLVFAGRLTTVSPRYAREITTEVFGEGLDGVIRARQAVLTGILNGVDYEEWNTRENPFLPHAFSAPDLTGKARCKAALQHELHLPVRADVPLFAGVSRLADQKGMDLALAALEEMLAADLQFALLGSGQPELEHGFLKLAARHPGKVAVKLDFNAGLSHRIEAGADFFLMPSRFEPCGLNQMYSLRYGTIPIVRRTGGLDDSVVDFRDDPEHANGIKFEGYQARALSKAIRKALALYAAPAAFAYYRRNGVAADFSWGRCQEAYEQVYRHAMAGPAS
ncbi:MAG: glycogen synthase GlgA [Limisphaerales bacterium]